jgi:short-subunit dehydrogenase
MDRQSRILLGAAAFGLIALRAIQKRMRHFSLEGKIVMITGGSRGLGLVIARELVKKGARVAICARDLEELLSAEEELRQLGGDVIAIGADVADREAIGSAIAEVENRFGLIDVLINNAGIMQVGPFETMNLHDFQRTMDVHYYGPLHACLAVAESMRARRSGRIVNISSMGGKIAIPHMLPYTASKFALTGFSLGLRTELVKDGVFVTTVFPSPMRTGSPINAEFKGQNEKEYTWFALSDAIPGISVGAERAARRIIKAIERGESELILGAPAKIALRLEPLFPELASSLLAFFERTVLPKTNGSGSTSRLGRESETPVTRSVLTHLTKRAAIRNNE